MLRRKTPFERYFHTLTLLLRDRIGFMAQIAENQNVAGKISALMVTGSVLFGIYGAIVGSFSGWPQAISSAVKLPILYLLTLLICFPTLYFFNILFGSRKSLIQHFGILISAVAAIGVLLFSFAPISLFFLVTTRNYSFFLLLNVAIMALTGIVGVKFLYDGMQMMSEQDDLNGYANRKYLLQAWLALYAFVGSQLGWTLRPFFGAPGEPFQLFRQLEGNFYQSVFNALLNLIAN
ncbi:MAG: actin-binding WH2 domain-containing protein [Geitlerinemataceae cyanobacterium]